MENNKINKKGFIISVIVFVVLFSIYGVYLFSSNYAENREVNVSEKYTGNKRFNDLVFSEIKVIKMNKVIHLDFTIENNSNKDFQEKNIKLVFLDKKGEQIEKTDLYIPTIKSKEKSNVDMIITEEMTKADNFILSDE